MMRCSIPVRSKKGMLLHPANTKHLYNICTRLDQRRSGVAFLFLPSIYLRRVLLPSPSPVLANIHSILAYDVHRTEDEGLPTKFGSMLVQRRSPLLVQCRSIVHDAGPTLIHHWVCFILCLNTWHSPNAVLMWTPSLRRWPVIETALGDSWLLHYAGTLSTPAPETPDNMIHWPNVDVLLGHRLRRWANIILTKTLWALNHKYNRDYLFLNICWRQKYLT